MRLVSLRLKNIRSYVDETLEFPRGVSLLSGDIGSGKTTILLAVEFAIFGIMKGVLSGSALLRHGENQGMVELSAEIGKNTVIIRRLLKRSKAGVVQDPGMLVVNGTSFSGTPQELKSRILELLGYPESLLNKSKSLIFRYTVFTPQEEMKRILYESRDDRLDILRRLFNIDKYKRVKDNALDYTRELRNQINFLEGKIDSMPDKKQELEEYEERLDKLQVNLKDCEGEFNLARDEFERSSESLKSKEGEFEEYRRLEQEFEVKRTRFASDKREVERLEKDSKRLKEEIAKTLEELEGFDITKAQETSARLKEKREELRKVDERIADVLSKTAENRARKDASEHILKKITKLDKCPTCLQKVTPDHIEEVQTRENVIINACKTNISKLEEYDEKFRSKKKIVQKDIDNLLEGAKEFEVKRVRIEALDEKKRQRIRINEEAQQLRERLQKEFDELEAMEKKIDCSKALKQEVASLRKDADQKRNAKESAHRKVVEAKSQADSLWKIIEKLKKELGSMKDEEAKLNSLKARKFWIEKEFISLVDLIEKNVLAKIYTEFNGFFQEWFNTLLEDDTIKVRLDDYFSPVIEQNGYETYLENLSGGEKTSVALSYRLALNRVINDFLSNIRTRDIIILDEPTEGFSSEQLDRVREVLDQANMLQTIIVSHEAKMEGFVDSVVRISKQNHVSKVSS